MKKPIYLLLALILIIDGCSKKEEVIIVPPCAVTKITITDVFDGFTNGQSYTFEYDASLRLTKSTSVFSPSSGTSSTSVVAYQYANGLVASATIDGGSPLNWTNENGHLVKISFINGGLPLVTSTTLLTYDGQGRVLTNNYMNDLGIGIHVNSSFTYGADGNIQKSVRTIFNGASSSGDFVTNYISFDGKNNPYALLAKAINQPYYQSGAYGEPNDLYYSKSNPVSASEVTGPITYSYEYSDSSYPTKVVVKHLTYTTTYLYEYKKCQ